MKKYYLHKHICNLLLLIVFIPSYGQADGNMFRCGIRDKAGNLWFGTIGAGVYRYDAASDGFSNFTKQDGLNSNHIESVFEDKAGNLWFGTTGGGLSRYAPSANLRTGSKSFTNFTKAKDW